MDQQTPQTPDVRELIANIQEHLQNQTTAQEGFQNQITKLQDGFEGLQSQITTSETRLRNDMEHFRELTMQDLRNEMEASEARVRADLQDQITTSETRLRNDMEHFRQLTM